MAHFSLNNKKAHSFSLLQLVLLAVIGFACAFAPIVVTLMWGAMVLLAFYGVLRRNSDYIWYTIAASPILEVLARMAKANFIPDEIGKYFLLLTIIFLLVNFLQERNPKPAHKIGIYLLVAIVPSLIVALSTFDYEQWVFNILSILEMAVLLIFISKERWDIERFCKTMQFTTMPIIFFLAYLTINTPDFSDINFALGANSTTSGGFGSNQVSTILGLGMVLIVMLLTLKRPFVQLRAVNYFLIGYLLFRGLLTFSRGGVVVAVLAIFIILLPAMLANSRTFIRYSLMVIALGILGSFVFLTVNEITGNQLLLRYEGETQGTRSGDKEKTLNKISSGRYDLALADVEIFTDNMFFGVGPGVAKDIRGSYVKDINRHGASAAHTEYTRLLSEHGIGGLLVCLLLSLFPVYWVKKQKINTWKGISAALFTIAVLTSMHAATRTNTTAVYFVLGAVPIVLKKGNTLLAKRNERKRKA